MSAIASIRKAQDAARALAARYPNGEKAVKARDVGAVASQIEAALTSAIIDVQVNIDLIGKQLAVLREVVGADVLYQWANEKNIGAQEWARRSDIINRVHAVIGQVPS